MTSEISAARVSYRSAPRDAVHVISRVSVLTRETDTASGQQGTDKDMVDISYDTGILGPNKNILTCGMVDMRSLRTGAGIVVGKHIHLEHVATLAVEGAVVAGSVAGLFTTVNSLDVAHVAIRKGLHIPGQSVVSFH